MKNYLNGDHLPVHEVKENDGGPLKWLRSKDVKKMLGISDSTLQTMRINGSITAYRLGSSWFYREDEILSALESGKTIRKEVKIG